MNSQCNKYSRYTYYHTLSHTYITMYIAILVSKMFLVLVTMWITSLASLVSLTIEKLERIESKPYLDLTFKAKI